MDDRWRNRIVGEGEVPADQLLANPHNWRIHPEAQQEALGGVLSRVGWVQRVIVNKRTGYVVDGHARVAMAIGRGESVPVVYVDLEPAEEKLVLATLDPLSAMAGRDEELLASLCGDIELTGIPALDELLSPEPDAGGGLTDPDDAPEAPENPVSRLGDLWILGNHRVLCGDSTKAEDVERLMGGEKADMVHADPPYGMNKDIENDNLHADKLDAFQMAWWRACRPHLADNGSAYIWGNAEELWRLWFVGGLRDSERMTLRNEIAWNKGDAGAGGISHMGADGIRQFPNGSERCLFFMLGEQGFNTNADNYWEGWEPIRAALAADCRAMGWGPDDIRRICGVGMYSHWFTKSQWGFIPEEHYRKLQAAAREHDAFKREHDDLKREHDDLKREFYATRAHFDNTHDNMTDVWDFKRVTSEERHGHETPKPVALVERAVKSSSADGAVVIEPFLGSGTTLIAAEKTNRRCFGLEIEPRYIDVIVRRWQDFTGKQAHNEDGELFDSVAEARCEEVAA